MHASTANIYISATKGVARPDEDGGRKYRRAEHTWMITVEPHQHHLPMVHKDKHPEPIHCLATWQPESNTYDVTTTGAENHQGIIGNVLVTDKAKISVDEMKVLLVERLKEKHSTLPSEATSPEESEHWIRVGLHALQSEKLVEPFDVGEFMTFAHAFVANRLDDESGAPAMVAYPGLHKDHAKKTQNHNFFLSYPMSGQMKSHSGTYAGLM